MTASKTGQLNPILHPYNRLHNEENLCHNYDGWFQSKALRLSKSFRQLMETQKTEITQLNFRLGSEPLKIPEPVQEELSK